MVVSCRVALDVLCNYMGCGPVSLPFLVVQAWWWSSLLTLPCGQGTVVVQSLDPCVAVMVVVQSVDPSLWSRHGGGLVS